MRRGRLSLLRTIAVMGIGATVPWYRAGGAPVPIAVYQPYGAASLAASYTNLVTPGTYDAAAGVAPTWDAVNGWAFDGAAWLNTGVVPASGNSMMVQYSGVGLPLANGWAAGVDGTNNKLYLSPYFAAHCLYGSGNFKSGAAANLSYGNLCVTNQTGYRNGVSDAAAIGAFSAAQTRAIIIGGLRNSDNSTGNYLQLFIKALAIWPTALSGDQVTAIISAINTDLPDNAITTATGSLGGQAYQILIPSSYDAAVGAPLCIYHHGAGDNQTGVNGSSQYDTKMALINAGYIIASSNAAGDNWGNEAGCAAYEALYTYVNANYNITRVVGWSQSMGGLCGLTGLADQTIPYDGWVGTYPVCNLADMFAGNAGVYAPAIRTAYGIAGDGSDYAAKTAGYDPALRLAAEYAGRRMLFFASAADTVVSKTNNSDALNALVTGQATENTVVVCTGDHGNNTHFQAVKTLQLFNRCA